MTRADGAADPAPAGSGDLDPLIYDFVAWLAREPKSYAVVIDTWRTSCPRLTVWEDAVEKGLVTRSYVPGEGQYVAISEAGLAFLRAYERQTKPYRGH